MAIDAPRDDVALSVACPRCDSAVGEVCRTSEGLPRAVHGRRTNAYLATLTPSQPHVTDA